MPSPASQASELKTTPAGLQLNPLHLFLEDHKPEYKPVS
jgi:hypothetical protein